MKKHKYLRTKSFENGGDDGIPPSHDQAHKKRVRIIYGRWAKLLSSWAISEFLVY